VQGAEEDIPHQAYARPRQAHWPKTFFQEGDLPFLLPKELLQLDDPTTRLTDSRLQLDEERIPFQA
jgi:hypothetical protein